MPRRKGKEKKKRKEKGKGKNKRLIPLNVQLGRPISLISAFAM